MDHHAHDWYHGPNTTGAFAFFRPQQFRHLEQVDSTFCNSVVIGEAASPNHAWVVGALESAVHGMHACLNC